VEDINWQMNDETIVRKTDREVEQTTFEPPSFEKVEQGDQMQFDAHVVVEREPEGQLLKKATVFSNVPNGGTWEIICDEGTAVGGRGSAPSPLMYFAAGMGLCLMSHVEMLAENLEIELDEVRLEQKTTFTTTLDLGGIHPSDVVGDGEAIEMHLVVEADAEPDRLVQLTEWCKQACMALQTVGDATPSPTAVFVNGERHDLEDEAAAA